MSHANLQVEFFFIHLEIVLPEDEGKLHHLKTWGLLFSKLSAGSAAAITGNMDEGQDAYADVDAEGPSSIFALIGV